MSNKFTADRLPKGTNGTVPCGWAFDPRLMVPALRAEDRMGAIKELVDPLHRAGYVQDSLAFLQSVLDREDLETTVIGSGVAFPHARGRSVKRLGVAVGLSGEGIQYGSLERVRFFVLVAVPYQETGYLQLMGELSWALRRNSFRSRLSGCLDTEEMADLLAIGVRHAQSARPELNASDVAAYCLTPGAGR